MIYLPLITNNYLYAPDLVVRDIVTGSDGLKVVIENQANAPVTNEFWVDAYVNPHPAPTAVNQIWNYLTDQGLVWGLTRDALPLPPGAVLTLTVGDAYFWPTLSQVSWPISAGTPLYAQVDSTNKHTDYGGVLESHEMVPNEKYNNILGPVYASATEGVKLGRSFALRCL